MPKLTAEQKGVYLKDSSHCPFCGSENISAGEPEFADATIWQAVECSDCGNSWNDIYTLTGVEDKE